MSTRILFVTGNYLPGKKGGIENYTHWLALMLQTTGAEVKVAALRTLENENYEYEGVSVYNMDEKFTIFQALIRSEQFDICHFQEYSSLGGIELPWFIEAKKYCPKVFFTFHLPYLTCYKGDFRYKGVSDCSNFSSVERCVECCIASKLHYQKGAFLNVFNYGIDLLMPVLKKSNEAIVLREKIENRSRDLRRLLATCDKIFIYGKWFRQLLSDNGYSSASVVEISHISDTNDSLPNHDNHAMYKKLLFAGRIEKQKGLRLLCNALRSIRDKSIKLDVYGNVVDERYFANCRQIFDFNYFGPVPRNELNRQFANYDFLVLPSVFTEMNSLVLREALFKKLPVIVSSAKGNKDVVTDGTNGFIFEYDNSKDLSDVIRKAYGLKETGWQPVFEYSEHPDEDVAEILSYYQ